MNFIRKGSKEVLKEHSFVNDDGSILPLLSFPLLDETAIVMDYFTSRAGGVSNGIWSSLNLSFTRGDNPAAVRTNFSRLAKAMGVAKDRFVFSKQTHTTNVYKVTEADGGRGLTRELGYTDVDGLITNVPGMVLSTFYADCVPLYIVDPVHKAIGLSHSGWRGTVSRMGAVTLARMKEEYGTDPADTVCAIGPSICQDCYEISRDVAEEFIQAFPAWSDQILIDKGNDKFQLDLWECNRRIFIEAGVPAEQIAVTDICTCCNPDLLFSHRASHGKRGNLAGFLMLLGEDKA